MRLAQRLSVVLILAQWNGAFDKWPPKFDHDVVAHYSSNPSGTYAAIGFTAWPVIGL